MSDDEQPPWSLTRITERVGLRDYSLVALDGFENNVARLYGHLRGRGDPQWRTDISPMFGVIWGSARAIAARMDALGPELRDQPVLELACGLALPSLVAAHHGARVTATDQHPNTEQFLRRNLAENQLTGVRYAHVDLRSPVAAVDGGPFRHVIASDVLYAHDLPPLLADAFAALLRPGGTGLLADPGRAWLDDFLRASEARGLEVDLQVDEVRPVAGEPHPGEVFVAVLRSPG